MMINTGIDKTHLGPLIRIPSSIRSPDGIVVTVHMDHHREGEGTVSGNGVLSSLKTSFTFFRVIVSCKSIHEELH